MRIKSIRVRNFKSFKDCTINFNDFNVVIGSNASGKSNLVQIFKFLKDIEEYGLENAISLQGGVEYFRNNQIGASEDFYLEIVFSYDNCYVNPFDANSKIFFYIKYFCYKIRVQFNANHENKYQVVQDELIQKGEFIFIEEKDSVENILLREGEGEGEGEVVFYVEENNIKFRMNIPNKLEDFIRIQANNNSIFAQYRQSIEILINTNNHLKKDFLLIQTPFFAFSFPIVYEQNFNKISIFDFEPKLPKKATSITGKIDLEEDGRNLAIVLNKILKDPEKQRKLSNLVTDLLPFIDTLKVEKFADQSLIFKLKETYAKNNEYLPAAFISDGTINIVALIVALYFSNTSFTIIEEPERNLHPSLISKVVEMMKDASKQKQTLVTTHNPEMIKYADLEDILLISRDEDGFSQITRPADSERVKIFLENEIGMDELYIQNLLG